MFFFQYGAIIAANFSFLSNSEIDYWLIYGDFKLCFTNIMFCKHNYFKEIAMLEMLVTKHVLVIADGQYRETLEAIIAAPIATIRIEAKAP